MQASLDDDYKRGGEGNLSAVKRIRSGKARTEADLRSPDRGRQRRSATDFYPLLLRFRDERDPATVEIVSPSGLEAAFGPGYQLQRVFVTVVDEPVTRAITKRLPWLLGPDGNPRQANLFGRERFAIGEERPLTSTICYGSFVREPP